MSPGEMLWDGATIAVIWILARKVNRWRAEATRWQRLAELNIRRHLLGSGEAEAALWIAREDLKHGEPIPRELLEKLGTLRPGIMARRRYAEGGFLPTPPPATSAAIQADLDRRIAAEEARRARLNKTDPNSSTEQDGQGNEPT